MTSINTLDETDIRAAITMWMRQAHERTTKTITFFRGSDDAVRARVEVDRILNTVYDR